MTTTENPKEEERWERPTSVSPTQLPAYHPSITGTEGVVANSAPVSMDEHLHPAFTQSCAIHQANRVGKVAGCEREADTVQL